MAPDIDPIRPIPALPEREPADHEVAAGAIAGVGAGALACAVAVLASPVGERLLPIRLVAAAFLGHEALDPGSPVPVLLGLVLGALASVILALVFASILPRGLGAAGSAAAGLAFGAAAWGVTWWVVVRIVDPVLFAAVSPEHALLFDVLYGALLGLFLPPLRRVLP